MSERMACRQTVPGAAAVVLAAMAVQNLEATRISVGVPVTPEPWWHSSYVTDGGGAGIILTDWQYAEIIDRYTGGDPTWDSRYLSVDVVTNVCFGGGFLNDIDAIAGLEYSFASSVDWSKGSYNHEDILPTGEFVVDNFPRAYRQAIEVPANSIIDYFNQSTTGPVGARDPFSPITVYPPIVHNGQYSSADPAPNGFNDLRKIGGANQYVIMVAWGGFEARHVINIARMRRALLARGVPAANIVQLWGWPQGDNPPLAAGPWASVLPSDPAPVGLPGIVSTDGITPFHFEGAVSGAMFAGAFPLAENGAQLLIYNTGHGGHAVSISIWQYYKPIYGGEGGGGAGGTGQGRGHEIPIGGQETPGDSDGWHNSAASPDGYQSIQITFDEAPEPDVTLWINGFDFGLLADYSVTPGSELPLDPYVSGPQVHYRLDVDREVLGCTAPGVHPLCHPESMDIRFYGMDPETAMDSPRLLGVRLLRGDGDTLVHMHEHELIPTPCYGDANGDRVVDFSDLNVLLINWAQTTAEGDLNSDGYVNFSDLNLVLLNWGNACP